VKNKKKESIALSSIEALSDIDAEAIKQTALKALRNGDFDFALKAIQRGDASIPEMVEDLKVYQAELEVQNEELRQSQLITENAVQRFRSLFASLPNPALVVDSLGVVHECNDMAIQRFRLDRKQLRSHYFPRMVKKQDHGRLHKLINEAKDLGQAMIGGVALESVEADVFIADLYVALLPAQADSDPRFVVTIVDQTERIAQGKALEASYQHFMAYFEASPVGMAAISVEKDWIEVNQKLCHLLGYSEVELRNETWLAITDPADIQTELENFNRVIAGEVDGYSMDKRFIRRDHTFLDVHTEVNCLRKNDGSIDYFVAIVVDTSIQKTALRVIEQQDSELKKQSLDLRERIKELKAIYAISNLSQDSIDLEVFITELLQIIPSGMQFPEDVITSISLFGKTTVNPPENFFLSKLNSEVIVDGVAIGELSVGYFKSHNENNVSVFYPEEQSFVDGVANIIARFLNRIRFEADQALTIHRNAALLALTTDASKMDDQHLLQTALEYAESLTSSHIAYVHFVNVDQESISLGTWSNNTMLTCAANHENHYPISKAGIWADCFRSRRSVVHNDYQAQVNKQGLPQGHTQLLRHMSVPVIADDKVVMILGVGNKVDAYNEGDITLLEMLANNTWALLERNRTLKKLSLDAEVFRNSREALMVTDKNLKIISVNPAFTLISGYEPEEAIGQTPMLLKSGQHNHIFYQKMWKDIHEYGHWQGEVWNRRKSGEIYPQWLGISSVKDKSGDVTEYIGVFMDITEHKETEARVDFLAFHDALTKLPNRALLRDRYEQSVAFAEREGSMVALLYLDLDHFKNVNDSLGHPVGDKLLIETASRLVNCVRDTDTVCRMGGDEFVVLLNDIKSSNSVADIASKILTSIAMPFLIDGKELNTSCSIGVCIYPDDGKDFDLLLQQSDVALYQSKNSGRNGYHFFTNEINRSVLRRLDLENELKKALSLKQIYIDYQPQFDIKTGRIIGVEALLRWRHHELGVISPAEFIPVAEDSGSIVELGHYVMLQACHQAKKWMDSGHDIRIAINVSYVQFLRNNLNQLVFDILHTTGLPPNRLELELTESILIADTNKVLNVVKALSDTGVLFSIDDFGTGYSSLSYLKRFAVGKLKIDQSFVRDVPGDSEDEVIVAAIIGLAHSLQLQCIAEGVETVAQAEFLKKMGCDQMQGFLLGKPMSPELLGELLDRQVLQ
jgi:diguanylate cyclase (GGDEF)-like protein/PAS domain S-box-containing protein